MARKQAEKTPEQAPQVISSEVAVERDREESMSQRVEPRAQRAEPRVVGNSQLGQHLQGAGPWSNQGALPSQRATFLPRRMSQLLWISARCFRYEYLLLLCCPIPVSSLYVVCGGDRSPPFFSSGLQIKKCYIWVLCILQDPRF